MRGIDILDASAIKPAGVPALAARRAALVARWSTETEIT
jgi:hypothetical protein